MQIVSTYSITTPRSDVSVDAQSRIARFTVDVKNEQPVLDRVVLGIESVAAGTDRADPSWFSVDRHLRPIPPGGSEQFLVSVTVPKEAAVGTYQIRPFAYSSDRPPDDTKVDGPLMALTVPPIPAPPRTAWWRRWWPWWLVAAVALVVLAVVATVVVVARSASVSVPSVVGVSEQQADQALTAGHLKVGAATRKFDATHANGIVLAQNPQGGVKAKRGSIITLTIAENVTIPDVVGKPISAADDALVKAGFKVTISAGSSATAQPDSVVTVDPAAGTRVEKGSTVALTVVPRHVAGPVSTLDAGPGPIRRDATISAKPDTGYRILTDTARFVVVDRTGPVQLTWHWTEQSSDSISASVTVVGLIFSSGFVRFRLEFDEIAVS